MFFDDRLATVLRQRASSDVGLRTQFRQLLDIMGEERLSPASLRDPSLVASAWLRMDALADEIPADARARMIREPGWRFRNPELAAHLASFEPEVASAALNRAQLSEDDWTALIPRLPVRARGFLRLRRDLPHEAETLLDRLGVHDRGLPRPASDTYLVLDEADEIAVESLDETGFKPPPPIRLDGIDADAAPPHDVIPASAPLEPSAPVKQAPEPKPDPVDEGRSEISALVERIARFKRNRDAVAEFDATEPRLPLGEEEPRLLPRVNAFGFAADAGGRIEWADGDAAAMVIGTRLVAPPRLGAANRETALERAFFRRQPIIAASRQLIGAEAIAGEWFVDAQPRFTDSGNFAGYVGRFRRPADTVSDLNSPARREADRIRQLLHELRTPVTAVQGYAEVIQQQLFGTAPHEYRALAAAIAADAARILAGFEELDRLAKLETGALEIDPGDADLTRIALQTNRQLDQVLQPRMAGIIIEDDAPPAVIAIDSVQAEGLLWRLLATLGGGCSSGEMLDAKLEVASGLAMLSCGLPAQLLAEEDIFTAEVRPIGTSINAGLFGAGFALRLARAEARAAGGDLVRKDESIILTLPLLREQDHPQKREEP